MNYEELVEKVKEIIATGCCCDRHCDGMTGHDVYCGCEKDARAVISAVGFALDNGVTVDSLTATLAASPLSPKG